VDIKVIQTSLQATGSRLRASGTEVAGVAGGPQSLSDSAPVNAISAGGASSRSSAMISSPSNATSSFLSSSCRTPCAAPRRPRA
jgi:hypothetical protein